MIRRLAHTAGRVQCRTRPVVGALTNYREPLPLVCSDQRRQQSGLAEKVEEEDFKTKFENFCECALKGAGQVVFSNSAKAGALILTGLTVADPFLGVMATLGTVSATSTAKIAQLDDDATRNGLMGYNGFLVGAAFSVFLDPSGYVATATIAGASVSALMTVPLKNALGSVPQMTYAFNFTALPVLMYTRPLETVPFSVPQAMIEASGVSSRVVGDLSMYEWMFAPVNGLGQIIFLHHELAGLAVLGTIAMYSRGAAAHALGGATVGVWTATMMGADATEIANGLWSFNPALTSLAVSIFFVQSPQVMALSMAGAATSAVLFGGLKTGMAGAFAVPALTLPFCLAATGCHLLRDVPGIKLAKSPHSPEMNVMPKRTVSEMGVNN